MPRPTDGLSKRRFLLIAGQLQAQADEGIDLVHLRIRVEQGDVLELVGKGHVVAALNEHGTELPSLYLRSMPAVENRTELVQALETNAIRIQGFGVTRLGVFGSFARDAATPISDVDLLVEFKADQRTLKDLMGLSRYLEALLGRKVELVTPGALNAFTGKYILQEVQYVALAA